MTQGLEPTANAVPPFYRRLPDTCRHGTQARTPLSPQRPPGTGTRSLVQAFPPEPSVERLDEGVVCGLARPVEVQLNLFLGS